VQNIYEFTAGNLLADENMKPRATIKRCFLKNLKKHPALKPLLTQQLGLALKTTHYLGPVINRLSKQD
jgi:hypothetical protein